MRNNKILIAAGAALLLLLVGGFVVFIATQQVSSPKPPAHDVTGAAALQAKPGDTVVTLNWQPVQGAVGYSIYRNGAGLPLNTVPVTATTYTDIGLSNGRTYTYTVSILDVGGKPALGLPAVTVAPQSR